MTNGALQERSKIGQMVNVRCPDEFRKERITKVYKERLESPLNIVVRRTMDMHCGCTGKRLLRGKPIHLDTQRVYSYNKLCFVRYG